MAFFISGGKVSTHCTDAERCFAKSKKGERSCFNSPGVKSGTALLNSRKIVLPIPGIQPGMGSTIFLEFSKAVPDLTPGELKQLLSPFLDFAKQRSASVQWVDTLPPEMKKAIQERRPTVGMDREEVIAAIGKPEHKVRERDSDGNEIEDWIYGQPPSKTVFVRFMGDRVTSIKQYPQ